MDLLVWFRQQLVNFTGALEYEAGAAGSAHAERVPINDSL
jgi:hypothetical protein